MNEFQSISAESEMDAFAKVSLNEIYFDTTENSDLIESVDANLPAN